MTEQDERIDFSALDPARDEPRWQALVTSVAERALASRRRRLTVAAQLVAWARPSLAIAAGLALFAWAGAWASGGKPATGAARAEDPAFALAQWASTGELPPTAQLMQTFGGSHGRK